MKWGQEWECMQPSSSEREKNFDLGFLRKKSIHVVVKFCAYKSLGMQIHEKCFSI